MKKTLLFAVVLFCAALLNAGAAKNIILVISDGNGPQEVGLLSQYARYAPHSPYADRTSNLEKLFNKSTVAYALTGARGVMATDSAASGTQIATGKESVPGNIGVDWEGNSAKTILEYARDAGKSTGLITTVYLQDATPAVFAAHQKNRGQQVEIARDMLNADVSVMFGGGRKHFEPLFNDFKSKGYKIALDKKEFLALSEDKGVKTLGVFAESEIPFVITRQGKEDPYPTLKEMTEKAVNILDKNKKGFFLMVEAGRVDWALHNNDAAAVLHELIELDDTLGFLLDWADKRKDTLIVFTADHDTGGFGFNYHRFDGAALRRAQASGEVLYDNGKTDFVSHRIFDVLMLQTDMFYNASKKFNALPEKEKTEENLGRILKETVGADVDPSVYAGCKDIDCARKKLDDARGIVWAAPRHTSTPVPVAAWGAGQNKFGGLYHTTELNKRMMEAFGFGVK